MRQAGGLTEVPYGNYPHVTYREALGFGSLETPFDRRQAQSVEMFQDISNNPDHKLYRFLPEPNKCSFNVRNSGRYYSSPLEKAALSRPT